jgi:hypothetical protein
VYKKLLSVIVLILFIAISGGCISINLVTQVDQGRKIEIGFETPISQEINTFTPSLSHTQTTNTLPEIITITPSFSPTQIPTTLQETKTITPVFTETQTPISSPIVLFEDTFSTNSLNSYSLRGNIYWDSSAQDIRSTGVPNGDSAMYIPINIQGSFVVMGRAFIPSSGIGRYDSISLAVGGGNAEYWGDLMYGNNLIPEKNNITISRNDRGETLYPMVLSYGWYTIKMYVNLEENIIYLKAWADNSSEPDWQLSRLLDPGWVVRYVGFRHAGDGPSWMDDLTVIAVPAE